MYAILFELTLFIDLRGLPGGGKGAVLDYLPGLRCLFDLVYVVGEPTRLARQALPMPYFLFKF